MSAELLKIILSDIWNDGYCNKSTYNDVDCCTEQEKTIARTGAVETAAKYILAQLEQAKADTELLDFLDQHADVHFDFDRAVIEIDIPDEFDGANTVRDVVRAAFQKEEK